MDGQEALDRFGEERFDLVVLDIMLPKLDGIEVCRRLRTRSQVPIIMLTAKADEIDKVVGLELGADDYITKPFSVREFRSRVKAALRRAKMAGAGARERAASVRGTSRSTSSAAPFSCTRSRCSSPTSSSRSWPRWRSPRAASSRATCSSSTSGATRRFRDQRTVDVHIRHLREKLETDPKNPEYLFTVRGVGYRFRDADRD